MPHFRLETKTRYYDLQVGFDLLGDVFVLRRWGGKRNRRGNAKEDVFKDMESATKMINQILSRRAAHGYVHIAGDLFN